jgi:hypothetical protein
MSSMMLNVDLVGAVSKPCKATTDAMKIGWLRMLLASLSGTTGCWAPADSRQLSNSYRSAFAPPIADLNSSSIVVQKKHPGAWPQLADHAEENSSMMTSRAPQPDADESLSAGRQGTGRSWHGNRRCTGVRPGRADVAGEISSGARPGHDLPERRRAGPAGGAERTDRAQSHRPTRSYRRGLAGDRGRARGRPYERAGPCRRGGRNGT